MPNPPAWGPICCSYEQVPVTPRKVGELTKLMPGPHAGHDPGTCEIGALYLHISETPVSHIRGLCDVKKPDPKPLESNFTYPFTGPFDSDPLIMCP